VGFFYAWKLEIGNWKLYDIGMMKIKNVFLMFIVFCLLSVLNISVANAASLNLIGDISVVKNGTSFALTDYQLAVHKIGSDQIWQGGLTRDGDRLNFNLPVTDIVKNDQLVLTVEAMGKDKTGREAGFFGGKTLVITSDQLDLGLLDNLNIEMNVMPIPEYEQSEGESLKICWKGMGDFSVIGYEVYRANEKAGNSWEMVGRSGQNANKQVCFLDGETTDKTVYYKLAVMTSWNAGEGKEVYVSQVLSEISDGIKFGEGVVDKIVRKNEVTVATESDQTENIVSASETDGSGIVGYWSIVDKWFSQAYQKFKTYNINFQTSILIVLAGILFLIILYFVLSVWLSNMTSKNSGVWREK